MNVLLVNTSETTGGAAIACGRILKALRSEGVDAHMMVRNAESHDEGVIPVGNWLNRRWCFLWERFVIWLCNALDRNNLFKVSIANSGIDITRTREFIEADVINLHWVNQGMLSLKIIGKILKSGKPVIWTMHDMWPCTGICHHAYECNAFGSECGGCPFLRFPGKRDLSFRIFQRKLKMFEKAGNLTFVAVSSWLEDKASKSALTGRFPVRVIPNVLPLAQFNIIDRSEARRISGIHERYVLAFGAARIDDPIKGFGYLTEALRLLVVSGQFKAEDIRLLLFGRVRDNSVLDNIPVPYSYLGYIADASNLSQVYSASDATVSSSLYETFGQTLIEAMACGSIPVSFDGSGQTDIITHKQNGFLAQRLSAESLAEGIAWAFNHHLPALDLRQSVISRYSESAVARQYISLFQ
ncbi:MAG: glycosyltransferase [Bacteroidales bacterium]|nr:glycosyltransferase [Bacteroidales bacterium]